MTKDSCYLNVSQVNGELNVAFCVPDNICHLKIHEAGNYQLFPCLAYLIAGEKNALGQVDLGKLFFLVLYNLFWKYSFL